MTPSLNCAPWGLLVSLARHVGCSLFRHDWRGQRNVFGLPFHFCARCGAEKRRFSAREHGR